MIGDSLTPQTSMALCISAEFSTGGCAWELPGMHFKKCRRPGLSPHFITQALRFPRPFGCPLKAGVPGCCRLLYLTVLTFTVQACQMEEVQRPAALCKILDLRAGHGTWHTGFFSVLCSRCPGQRDCWGKNFPVERPCGAWPSPMYRRTLCTEGLYHLYSLSSLSLFSITPTGGNSQSGGAATPKPPGPAWPRTSDRACDAAACCLASDPPAPLAQFPQALAFPLPLWPWSVTGMTQDPLPTSGCMEEVRHLSQMGKLR